MKYKCILQVEIPIRFAIDKEVPTSFFMKDNIEMRFLSIKEGFFNGLELSIIIETDKFVVNEISSESLSFYKYVQSITGPIINKFYTNLCNLTNNLIQKIYNGEDFIFPHRLAVKDIENNEKLVGGYDALNVFPRLAKSTFDRLIMAESDVGDIVGQLLQDSQNFLGAGLLDMALLNAYVALEVCVKKKFSKSFI